MKICEDCGLVFKTIPLFKEGECEENIHHSFRREK